MLISDIFSDDCLTEAIRQWKRTSTGRTIKYRCTSGIKKGKLVASPSDCTKRKDPTKVKRGKKLMRIKKQTIARKSKISKRTALSRAIARINARLSNK